MGTPPEAVETRRNVSGAQVAIIVGALVVVLALLWFFFLRGGDEETLDTGSPTTPTTEPTPEPTPTTKPGGKGPVETFEVFTPKDPFDPLVVASAGGGGGTTDGGTTPPPGDGTNPPPDNTPGNDGGGNVGGHRVRVVSVFQGDGGGERAQVQIDGTVYTVSEGERFAENFEVVSISGDCVTMLFGDDEFTLCEGQEILK